MIKFREFYIRTGIFTTQISDIINLLSESRNKNDYNIMFSADYPTAHECLESAEIFYNTVNEYLKEKYNLT
jgi:uncharacterized protein (UPF0332 family)